MEEVEDWITYVNKRGTMNLGLRVEAGFALIAWLLCRAHNLKKEDRSAYAMADFMWHMRDEEKEAEINFEDAIKAFHKIGIGE